MSQQIALVIPEELQRQLDTISTQLRQVSARLDQAQITPAPEWVTVKAAATILGVNPSTINRRIARGELRAKGAGHGRRVRINRA